jgi:hypothetical protein
MSREQTILEMEFDLAMSRLEREADYTERLGVLSPETWPMTLAAVKAYRKLRLAQAARAEIERIIRVIPEIGR